MVSVPRKPWLLVAALALLPALLSCGPLGGQGQAVADTGAGGATAGAVSRGHFRSELLLTGELEAVRSIAIKSPQTAMFQMRIQFMAEEGTVVEKGEPLIDFDNSSIAAQVRELETKILDAETQIVAKRSELASALKDLEIEVAEAEYEHQRTRLEASVDPSIMSRKEYSERQLAYEKAERELKETHERIDLTRERGQAEVDVLVIDRDKLKKDLTSAEQDLELLSIKAPAKGLVVYASRPRSTLRFQEGDSCWPGEGVLSLPDLSEMQVSFSVNEVDAPHLKVGMPVRVTLDAFPGRELSATISHVPSMAVKSKEESKIAVFKVIAGLSETWVGEMKPGMSVLGKIVIEETDDAPLVSRHSVRFDGETYWLGVPSGDRGTVEIEFQPIARNATHYLVSEEEHARIMGGGS